MKYLLGLLCSFLCLKSGFAQYDTTYVNHYPGSVTVSPYLSVSDFRTRFIAPNGLDGNFYANQSNKAGLRLSFRNLIIGASFKLPSVSVITKKYGQTTTYDLNLRLLRQRFTLEFSLRGYKGLTDLNSPAYTPDGSYYTRPDLSNATVELAGIYILSPQKFSYRAAYFFLEKQKKTAGTWILSAGVFSNVMKGNQPFFNSSVRENFETMSHLQNFSAMGAGLGGGYGYTYVKKDWFFSAIGWLGADFRMLNYTTTKPADTQQMRAYEINPSADLRLSFGYNTENWFLGLQANHSLNVYRFDVVSNLTLNRSISLLYGYRFKAPKFLIKFADKLKRKERTGIDFGSSKP